MKNGSSTTRHSASRSARSIGDGRLGPMTYAELMRHGGQLGTTARTVYALALYFGHRRSDVATVKWSDLEVSAGNVVQRKTGKALWIPMQPELMSALAALERRGEYVVLTQYGKPFSVKALG